jgi:small subunit ribosomal protein S2
MSKYKIPTLEELLSAGVHFGHRKERWNPKMKSYVFGLREDVSIIDLEKTQVYLEKALDYIVSLIADDKEILFLSTKKQAQKVIIRAEELGLPYINHRWLGGTFTNFETIKKSIDKYNDLCKRLESNELEGLTKFEISRMTFEMKQLEVKYKGIKNLKALPAALFVVDTVKEDVAVKEALVAGVPIIAFVDSNSDPTKIDYPIPANDDAIKSVELILNLVFDTIESASKKTKTATAKKKKENDKETDEDKNRRRNQTS